MATRFLATLTLLAAAPLGGQTGERAPARYAAGLRQLAVRDAAGARATFESIVQREPDFARAYYGILLADRQLGQPGQTLATFQAWRPQNPFACYATAFALHRSRQSEQAAAQAKDCTAATPAFLPLYRLLALAAAASGQLDAVHSWLESRLAASPDDAALRYGLGAVNLSIVESGRTDRFALAKTHLEAARSALPGRIDVEDSLFFLFDAMHATAEVEGVLLRMKALAEAAADEDWLVKVIGRLAHWHLNRGDPERALALLEPRMPVVRALPFRDLEGYYLSSLAEAQYLTGRLSESLTTYAEARRNAAASGATDALSLEARIAGKAAQAHKQMGSFGPALAGFREALAIARSARDGTAEAYFWTQIAELAIETGQTGEAVEAVRSGLELARATGFAHSEYITFLAAGGVLQSLGKSREALEALRRGLSMARAGGDELMVARYLLRLAAALEKADAPSEAEPLLAEWQGMDGRLRSPGEEALQLQTAAAIELRKGRTAVAEAYYRRQAGLGARYALPAAVWNANAGMARCLARAGKWAEALEAGAAAIAAVEGVRLSLLSAEHRAAFLAARHGLYRDAVAAAVHLGNLDRAFELAEQGRARSLVDMMADPAPALAGPEGRRERQLRAELAGAQVEIFRLARERRLEPASLRDAEARLRKLQEEHQSLSWTVRGAAPPGTSVEAVRRALPARSAMVTYQLGERESFAFAITRQGIRVARLGPSQAIVQAAVDFRSLVSQPPQRARQATLAARSAALHRLAIAPLLGYLSGVDRIVVAADGALHSAPFEALEPMLPRYTFSYVPAASVWLALQLAPALERSPVGLLAYGGASYGGSVADATRAPGPGEAAWRLGPLPGSLAEVERIAKAYPAFRATLRTGASASESNLKRDLAEGSYETIHLAVHGLLNESRPRYSALAFSLPAVPVSVAPDEDGLLQSFEIERLRIRANLVVLSACDTARGQTLTGEGVLGLTRAFLSAGARSVVASLWKVDDRATARLMADFYAGLRRGLPPDEALRRAKLAAVSSGTWAHPFYWAGFVLTGAGR